MKKLKKLCDAIMNCHKSTAKTHLNSSKIHDTDDDHPRTSFQKDFLDDF